MDNLNVPKKRFFDAGAYLTTPTFKGIYDGIKEHEADLAYVLNRSWRRGIENIIIPGINLNVSREALEIAKTDSRLFCTVGCSPARSHEFNKEGPQEYLASLAEVIENNRSKVVALGEIGLDYRWLEICDKDTQLRYLELQLDLARNFKLPVLINSRSSVPDMLQVLKKYDGTMSGGLIHSFDGTLVEAEQFLNLGYRIGINGCSLRTEDSLMMVKSLPLESLVLESNAPWCLLKPMHAGYRFVRSTYPARAKFHWSPESMVRGRNEPANINQILEVISNVKEEDPITIAETVYKTTKELFAPPEPNVKNEQAAP